MTFRLRCLVPRVPACLRGADVERFNQLHASLARRIDTDPDRASALADHILDLLPPFARKARP